MNRLLLCLTLITASLFSYAQEVYSPEDALKDISAGKLRLVGRQQLPNNYQNYSCVYQSDTAYVIQSGCRGNPEIEATALHLTVLRFNGDQVKFTLENQEVHERDPVTNELILKPNGNVTVIPQKLSEKRRSEYDQTWSINYEKKPAISPGLSFQEVYDYYEKNSPVIGDICSISGVKNTGNITCHNNLSGLENSWSEASRDFHQDPPESWYQTQKLLREHTGSSGWTTNNPQTVVSFDNPTAAEQEESSPRVEVTPPATPSPRPLMRPVNLSAEAISSSSITDTDLVPVISITESNSTDPDLTFNPGEATPIRLPGDPDPELAFNPGEATPISLPGQARTSESCQTKIDEFFEDPDNKLAKQEYLKIQGQITLHRLAWTYLKLSQDNTDDIEKTIGSLLVERNSDLHREFINKESATRNQRLKVVMQELKIASQELVSEDVDQAYALQYSDIKMMDLLAEAEEAHGRSSKTGVMDFTSIIRNSLRNRDKTTNLQKASKTIDSLIDKKDEFEEKLADYLSEIDCSELNQAGHCEREVASSESDVSNLLSSGENIIEHIYQDTTGKEEELKNAFQWNTYWLRVE